MEEIIIPRNTLVVLVGPAGCGKTTFAARHFLPTEIVSSDHCRALVSDDATNQRVSPLAFELMHSIIEKRLMLGRLTVADATHLERGTRRGLIKLGRRYGYHLTAIVFNIPLATCLARNARRVRVVPENALLRQHELFATALRTIETEGFDAAIILDEKAQRDARVRITRRSKAPLERD